MKPELAIQIMNGFSYRPEWRFETRIASDGCVILTVCSTQPDSDKEFAPKYATPRELETTYILDVKFCRTDEDLANLLFVIISDIEEHERREFLAISGSAYHKPFHPHTEDGCEAWNQRRSVQLTPYGIAGNNSYAIVSMTED